MADKSTFRLECEMLNSTRDWMRSRGLHARPEFVTPWGVCDLFGVSFNRSRVKQRLNLGQSKSIGPLRRFDLLSRIPDAETGRSIRIASLRKQVQTFIEAEQVEADIEALIESKFVIKKNVSSVQKLNGWMPLSNRVVAVELKLDRVAEALNQARLHLRIADQVYVALPAVLAERVVRTDRKAPFITSGVGVLSVTHADCRVVLPAKKMHKQCHCVLKAHCVERLWRWIVRGSTA